MLKNPEPASRLTVNRLPSADRSTIFPIPAPSASWSDTSMAAPPALRNPPGRRTPIQLRRQPADQQRRLRPCARRVRDFHRLNLRQRVVHARRIEELRHGQPQPGQARPVQVGQARAPSPAAAATFFTMPN